MRAGDIDVDDLRALLSELSEVGGRMDAVDEARPYSRRARGRVGTTNTLADQMHSKTSGLALSSSSRPTSGNPSPHARGSGGVSGGASVAPALIPKAGGFSTYSTVGVGDVEQAQRNYATPLNIRLAPLQSGGGKGPGGAASKGPLNPLPALSGGAVSKGPKVLPNLADFGVLPKEQDNAAQKGKTFDPDAIPTVPPRGKDGKLIQPVPPSGDSHQGGAPLHRRAMAEDGATTTTDTAAGTTSTSLTAGADPNEYRETNFLPIMCARYLQPAGLTPPPRWGHTLTPLAGGSQLLMFGGMEVSGKSTAQLMTFNTSEISWEPLPVVRGDSPAPRHSHAACAYEGHCLVVYGGMSTTDSGMTFGDIHLFDLYTQEWRCLWSPGRDGGNKKNEPAPRYGHSMVLRHHRLYIFGGRVKKQGSSSSAGGGAGVSSGENNSTISNTNSISAASSSLANSDIYVFSLSSGHWKKRIRVSGKPSAGVSPAPPAEKRKGTKGSEAVRPEANSAMPACPSPRSFHAACIKRSLMYINGGGGAEGTVFNDTWVIDLNNPTGSWVCVHAGQTADAYARERHDLFSCGEALLVVGGCSSSNRFNERVAGKFNNFAAVLPVTGLCEAPVNPCWIPVAMGNMSIVAPNKRSFAAAFSGGFVYVFGGQSGSEPATNSMIRFLAADGYTTTDARGTAEGNDEALRNVLLQLRESNTLPFDAYAIATTQGAISGSHDINAMVGLHKAIVQQRAPKLWAQLLECRNEPLRAGLSVASSAPGQQRPGSPMAGDSVDALLRGPRGAAAAAAASSAAAASQQAGSSDPGVLVYYTNGNQRVKGLHQTVHHDELRALAIYLYSGNLPRAFYTLLEEEGEGEGEDGEDDPSSVAQRVEKEQRRASLKVLQNLAGAYGLEALGNLCEACSSGQRRLVEKAVAQSTQQLRKDLLELLQTGKGATVTVLFVDPHTKEQSTHALHPAVLMGASPFFADLLRPLYLGHKTQFQVGPVAAKVTGSGSPLLSSNKRSVLVGPVSIPKLAVQPILRFLYSQVLRVPKEVAYVTMLGAHQLDLPLLQGYCEAIVAREEVNYDSCCGFYHLSRKYEAFLLEEMSLLTAVTGYSTVRYTVGYKNLSEEDRHSIDDVANELGSSSWVPPPAPTNELKPSDDYEERWKGSMVA